MALTRPSFNQINSTVTALNDPLTVVNKSATSANQDVGFVFNRDGGATANVAIVWDETNDQFALVTTSSSGATNANVTISDYADLRVDDLTVSGNVSSTYFIGDGSALTNVGAGSAYGNTQVGTFLETYNGALLTVTTANIGQIGYTDNKVTTANIGQIGYTDNKVTTANIGQIGYTDNKVTTANIGQIGFTNETVTQANVGLKGYTDSQLSAKSSLSGATFTGNVSLGDSNYLNIGAGPDLTVYHGW